MANFGISDVSLHLPPGGFRIQAHDCQGTIRSLKGEPGSLFPLHCSHGKNRQSGPKALPVTARGRLLWHFTKTENRSWERHPNTGGIKATAAWASSALQPIVLMHSLGTCPSQLLPSNLEGHNQGHLGKGKSKYSPRFLLWGVAGRVSRHNTQWAFKHLQLPMVIYS